MKLSPECSVKLSYGGSFTGPPSQRIPAGTPRKIASFRHYNSQGASLHTGNGVREQDLELKGVRPACSRSIMAVRDPAALHHPDQSSPRATRPVLPGKNPPEKSGKKAADQHRRRVDRAADGVRRQGGSSAGIEGGGRTCDCESRRWGAEEQSGAVTTR